MAHPVAGPVTAKANSPMLERGGMVTVKRLWSGLVKLGLVAAFGGLGLFAVGLMIGALVYPTGAFWGAIVFLMGLFGLLLVLGAGMTARNRPRLRGSTG